MNETEFSKIARQALSKITDTIEKVDAQGLIDLDFDSDIINLETKQGIFVINKHSAAQEIWLASPISGPYHFAYKNDKWLSRENLDLFDILKEELKINFNEN